jgi:hypothetical protein
MSKRMREGIARLETTHEALNPANSYLTEVGSGSLPIRSVEEISAYERN